MGPSECVRFPILLTSDRTLVRIQTMETLPYSMSAVLATPLLERREPVMFGK